MAVSRCSRDHLRNYSITPLDRTMHPGLPIQRETYHGSSRLHPRNGSLETLPLAHEHPRDHPGVTRMSSSRVTQTRTPPSHPHSRDERIASRQPICVPRNRGFLQGLSACRGKEASLVILASLDILDIRAYRSVSFPASVTICRLDDAIPSACCVRSLERTAVGCTSRTSSWPRVSPPSTPVSFVVTGCYLTLR